MTHRLFSIGGAVAAIALTSVFAVAQGGRPQGQPGERPSVQADRPGPREQIDGRGEMGPRSRGPRGGAFGPGPRDGNPGALGPRRGFPALDLTEDQRTAITSLERASRDQAAPLQDELQFTRRTLHRELFADKRDNGKVSGLAAKIATLEKQLADIRIKSTTAMADLLTPEQRETLRAAEGGRGGGGFGRGPGRGGRGGPFGAAGR
jgi:Spy/CpxP family protein refolding chaperone